MVWQISEKEFEEKIQERCVIDFFATWCPPCKMIAPVIDELSEERSDVKFYKVNVDENEGVSEKYRISHVPTLILFEAGNEINRVSKYIDKLQLENFISSK